MNTCPVVRKPWERHRQVHAVKGESVTDTSFGNETDINLIVEKFARTGDLPQARGAAIYDDVTNLQGDLTVMLERTSDARKSLAEMQETQAKRHKEQLDKDAKELEELRNFKAAHEAQQPPSPDGNS